MLPVVSKYIFLCDVQFVCLLSPAAKKGCDLWLKALEELVSFSFFSFSCQDQELYELLCSTLRRNPKIGIHNVAQSVFFFLNL